MFTDASSKKFLLVSIVSDNRSQNHAYLDIKETIHLIESYGGWVEDIVLQKREVHDKGSYIGSGKSQEVMDIILHKGIDVVVLNAIIKPGQIYDFQTAFEKVKKGVQVWYRVDLILKIFSQRAKTKEAKLQIEMAAMNHMGPRIYGMGEEMSRQSGMIGTRGIGETNTERMKRHLRNQVKKVKDELEKISQNNIRHIIKRNEAGLKTVSIIGYTNAGKTSLFNLLSKKSKYVKNELFATLETSSCKLYLKDIKKEVLLTDTIGFIHDLPPQLIEAFKSTLVESIYADLLLHVVDSADDDMDRKIATVEQILKGMNVENKSLILVFNKIDKLENAQYVQILNKYKKYNPVFISVEQKANIDNLYKQIGQFIP